MSQELRQCVLYLYGEAPLWKSTLLFFLFYHVIAFWRPNVRFRRTHSSVRRLALYHLATAELVPHYL